MKETLEVLSVDFAKAADAMAALADEITAEREKDLVRSFVEHAVLSLSNLGMSA